MLESLRAEGIWFCMITDRAVYEIMYVNMVLYVLYYTSILR